ncbi:MAG: signal peptidase II [Lysobacterales bacterium]
MATDASLDRGKWANLPWLAVSAVVVLLDQLTKIWALQTLRYAEPVPVIPGLNWTLVYNRGGAFSLFHSADGWQTVFFLAVACTISVVLLVWLWREPARGWLPRVPIVMIIGGAVGNVIDRLRYGHVIDFIDVYVSDWHWPAFNIADSAISVGVMLLLAYEVFFRGSAGPK